MKRHEGVAFGLVLVGLLLSAPATGQPSSVLREAGRVALRQLDAFRRGDFDAAYAFASSEIKQIFDRQAFERMVRGGYPEIAASVSGAVTDGHLAPDGHAYLTLLVHGVNGNSVEALYDLVWEDGEWRINGVVTRPDASRKA